MSWGVATQNGVSVSLASIMSLSCGATEFSPASLFTSGVAGAWYDPSDYSTLFQDSAGTTPVTAVEQPVGLMLDKSQGLVLGSEIISVAADRDFSSNTGYWSFNSGVGISGGSMNWSATPDTYAGYTTSNSITTPGKYYEVTWTLSSISSGGIKAGAGAQYAVARTVAGTYTDRILAASAANRISFVCVGTTTASIDNVSVKEVAGNHASQATAASRPILRARYNLLTYSEDMSNSAWNKLNQTVEANTSETVDPLGGNTADKTYGTGVGSNWLRKDDAVSGTQVTVSLYLKAGTATTAYIGDVNLGSLATFNLSAVTSTNTGGTNSFITSIGNGWYRCGVTYSAVSGFSRWIFAAGTTYNANTTTTLYCWGADLRTGSSAGTYQRIAAATDYATAGFLPYLYFVTDDSFSTSSIDFTATDEMSVCAGITKLSDTLVGIVAELSANWNSNAGSFVFAAPSGNSPTNDIAFGSRGTAVAAQAQKTSVPAPVTAVATGLADISGDIMTLRYNGSLAQTVTSDQGTGNYGNYPLYIGRRNNASLPFNGNFYQLVVCGKTLSASELASTEAYVATKTGVTI